jgi:AraC-like DNA-binding protein
MARQAIAIVLELRGDLRIADLSLEVDLGRRQLERAFQDLVGVTPKAFARIVRFRAVVSELRRIGRAPRWADLAATFGYFDQAHLDREFQSLAGLTPGALVRERAMSHLSKTLEEHAPMFAARPAAGGYQREDRERDAHPDRGAD